MFVHDLLVNYKFLGYGFNVKQYYGKKVGSKNCYKQHSIPIDELRENNIAHWAFNYMGIELYRELMAR